MLFKKFIDRKSDVVRLGEALKRPDSQFIVVMGGDESESLHS